MSVQYNETFCESLIVTEPLQTVQIIEKSIQKKYRKELWSKFIKGVNDFNLVQDGDHIAVAISGGKDSLLLAKLFQLLQRTRQIDFKLSFISMDPGFHEMNRQNLEKNLKHLAIPCEIYNENIFERLDAFTQKYPCYMCARMRRGSLYAKAEEIGANKLALGHHLDDVVETVLLNIFYAGKYETMLPILQADNFNMQLIRPLYFVEEKNIIRFVKSNGIQAMNCGCVVAAGKTASKRKEMKQLVEQLASVNPEVKKNIISSTRNVNLSCILGYKSKDGMREM